MAIDNPEDWAVNMVNWKTNEPLIKIDGKPVAKVEYFDDCTNDYYNSVTSYVNLKNYDKDFVPINVFGKMELDEEYKIELEASFLKEYDIFYGDVISPLTYSEYNFEFLEI